MRTQLTIVNPFQFQFLSPEEIFFDFPTPPTGLTAQNADSPVEGVIDEGTYGYAIGVLRVETEGDYPALLPNPEGLAPSRIESWQVEAAESDVDWVQFQWETTEVTVEFGKDKPTLGELTTTFGWDDLFAMSPVINANSGEALIIGTREDDSLLGTGKRDRIEAYGGDDRLDGRAGNDRLLGAAGEDTLLGGEGNDRLWGQSQSDQLNGGDNRDSLYGGDGRDTLAGQDGVDFLYGGGGRDLLFGGLGDDSLVGGGKGDELRGQGGSDTLEGGNGNDVLNGGAKHDILIATMGRDVLIGGGGNDEFRILPDPGNHRITDFNAADNDMLVLSLMGLSGFPTFDYVGNSANFATAATLEIPGHGLLTIEFDRRTLIDAFEDLVLI